MESAKIFNAVARTPQGKKFILAHGLDTFYKFIVLYEDYANGKITMPMIARKLGVIRHEVETLRLVIEVKKH